MLRPLVMSSSFPTMAARVGPSPATASLSDDLQQRLASLVPAQGRAQLSPSLRAHGSNHTHARAQPNSSASDRVGHATACHVQYDSQTLADQVEGLALIERRLGIAETIFRQKTTELAGMNES